MSVLRRLGELESTFGDKYLELILDLGTEALKLAVESPEQLTEMVHGYYKRQTDEMRLRRDITQALDAYTAGGAS